MTRYALVLLVVALAGCPKTQTTETSGSTRSALVQATPTPTPTERMVGPDGRMQRLDAAGLPMFDAEGNPIWEPTPAERAAELFAEAISIRAQGGVDAAPLAEEKLRQVITLQPGHADAWYDLGLLQIEGNKLSDATRSLQEAIKLRGDRIEAWRALGIAYERSGRFDDADVAYANGLRIDAEDVDLLNGKARLLRKRGQYEVAAQRAKEILKINSNSLDAYNTLGLCYFELGQIELARFVYMKAEADVPGGAESAAVQANLGLLYWREGDEFEAQKRFEAARLLDPRDVGAATNLAALRLKNLDYSGARELLEDAYKALPGSAPVRLSLAVARRGTGDAVGARSLLEGLVGDDSEYGVDAVYNLAILKSDSLQDYDGSMQTWTEYFQLRERSGQPVPEGDAARGYYEEVEKLKKKQDRQREKDAKAAAKAAAKAPAENQSAGGSDGGSAAPVDAGGQEAQP